MCECNFKELDKELIDRLDYLGVTLVVVSSYGKLLGFKNKHESGLSHREVSFIISTYYFTKGLFSKNEL